MDEKNGRLYAESGPEREVCAMTMKCPNCGAEFFDGREVCTDCQTPLVKKRRGKTVMRNLDLRVSMWRC